MLSFFIMILPVNGQQQNDFGIWSAIEAEKTINKDFSLRISESLRMRENVSMVDQVFTQIKTNYRLSKSFKISGGYRFYQQQRSDFSYRTKHRVQMDLRYRFKMSFLQISYRTRWQSLIREFNSREDGRIPRHRFRHRLELAMNWNKRYQPGIQGEVFFGSTPSPELFVQHKYRLVMFVKYDINRLNRLTFTYLIQHRVNDADLLNEYISGISYRRYF